MSSQHSDHSHHPSASQRFWHVLLRGKPLELSERELAAKLRAGTIVASTMVWCEGMAEWAALETVKELAHLVDSESESESILEALLDTVAEDEATVVHGPPAFARDTVEKPVFAAALRDASSSPAPVSSRDTMEEPIHVGDAAGGGPGDAYGSGQSDMDLLVDVDDDDETRVFDPDAHERPALPPQGGAERAESKVVASPAVEPPTLRPPAAWPGVEDVAASADVSRRTLPGPGPEASANARPARSPARNEDPVRDQKPARRRTRVIEPPSIARGSAADSEPPTAIISSSTLEEMRRIAGPAAARPTASRVKRAPPPSPRRKSWGSATSGRPSAKAGAPSADAAHELQVRQTATVSGAPQKRASREASMPPPRPVRGATEAAIRPSRVVGVVDGGVSSRTESPPERTSNPAGDDAAPVIQKPVPLRPVAPPADAASANQKPVPLRPVEPPAGDAAANHKSVSVRPTASARVAAASNKESVPLRPVAPAVGVASSGKETARPQPAHVAGMVASGGAPVRSAAEAHPPHAPPRRTEARKTDQGPAISVALDHASVAASDHPLRRHSQTSPALRAMSDRRQFPLQDAEVDDISGIAQETLTVVRQRLWEVQKKFRWTIAVAALGTTTAFITTIAFVIKSGEVSEERARLKESAESSARVVAARISPSETVPTKGEDEARSSIPESPSSTEDRADERGENAESEAPTRSAIGREVANPSRLVSRSTARKRSGGIAMSTAQVGGVGDAARGEDESPSATDEGSDRSAFLEGSDPRSGSPRPRANAQPRSSQPKVKLPKRPTVERSSWDSQDPGF